MSSRPIRIGSLPKLLEQNKSAMSFVKLKYDVGVEGWRTRVGGEEEKLWWAISNEGTPKRHRASLSFLVLVGDQCGENDVKGIEMICNGKVMQEEISKVCRGIDHYA